MRGAQLRVSSARLYVRVPRPTRIVVLQSFAGTIGCGKEMVHGGASASRNMGPICPTTITIPIIFADVFDEPVTQTQSCIVLRIKIALYTAARSQETAAQMGFCDHLGEHTRNDDGSYVIAISLS